MYDDAHLTRYLFGMLDEKETIALNDAAIHDDDLALSIALVEDELVDAYVRDELDAESRARFEAKFLSTPYGQDRVAVARTLVVRADRHGHASAEERVGAPPSRESRIDDPRPTPRATSNAPSRAPR